MNTIPKWTGRKPDGMIFFDRKKDAAPDERHLLIRVDFGLFGVAFLLKAPDAEAVKCGSGYCPIHRARLNTGGYRIGMRDAGSAKGQPWVEEWENSMVAA